MELETCIRLRRDTRHFTTEEVPLEVLNQALSAAHYAPSVGLSEPWRFVLVQSSELKSKIYENFLNCRQNAENEQLRDASRRKIHQNLKLEAIKTAPVGLGVFCEVPDQDTYILGATTQKQTLQWSVACAIQNLWLSLTAQGFGAGWVSILDFPHFKRLLDVPQNWEPLGYLCIGRPATDYLGQPMLQLEGWRKKSSNPTIIYR